MPHISLFYALAARIKSIKESDMGRGEAGTQLGHFKKYFLHQLKEEGKENQICLEQRVEQEQYHDIIALPLNH